MIKSGRSGKEKPPASTFEDGSNSAELFSEPDSTRCNNFAANWRNVKREKQKNLWEA